MPWEGVRHGGSPPSLEYGSSRRRTLITGPPAAVRIEALADLAVRASPPGVWPWHAVAPRPARSSR